MLRWFTATTLLALVLTVAACSSSTSEIPANKNATPASQMSAKESAAKAIQGMPPEMQKKMAKKMKM